MRSPATRRRKPGASRLSCPRRFSDGGYGRLRERWPMDRPSLLARSDAK